AVMDAVLSTVSVAAPGAASAVRVATTPPAAPATYSALAPANPFRMVVTPRPRPTSDTPPERTICPVVRYSPGGSRTVPPPVAAFTAAWTAAVSSATPSPTAP